MSFKILTDSTADLSPELALEYDIDVLGLTVQLDGKVYETVGPDRLTSEDLLERMKEGAEPQTSQINVGTFEAYFRDRVQAGHAVLYVAFSSALSGTYQSGVMARDLVLEEYPDAVIEIVDTKAASMGEGYLAMLASEMRDRGESIQAAKEMIIDVHPRLYTYFLVDDLYHLMRGGRVSKSTAVAGSLMNVKPILWIDPDGNLKPLAKARGRKKAVKELVNLGLSDLDSTTAIIAYANDVDGAESLKKQLINSGHIQDVMVMPLGPILAAHTGPDTLVLFTINKRPRAQR